MQFSLMYKKSTRHVTDVKCVLHVLLLYKVRASSDEIEVVTYLPAQMCKA